jgi:hypothetical protein
MVLPDKLCHSYWLGSQGTPTIYQYRVILPYDEKLVNVATDADFNVEAEIKYPINDSLLAKSNFVVS